MADLTEQVMVRFPAPVAEALRSRAQAEERSVAAVVRMAVKAWVGSTAPEGQVQAVDPPQSKPAPPKKERAPRQKRPVAMAEKPADPAACEHVWSKSVGSSGNVVRTCSGCGAKS